MQLRLSELFKLFTFIFLTLLTMFASTQAFAENKQDYLLGAGDAIRVNVFQNPELMTEARVSENGVITYPLIGEITLGGKTIQAAEKAIAQALISGKFLQEPQVNIVLLQIRGNQIAVLGLVNRPGRYALETFNMRLSDMVATAGGVAQIAGNGFALVTGIRDGKPFRYEVDLATLFLADKKTEDILVSNGDVIYITPGNQVSIIGQVLRPGRFTLEAYSMRLADAIALAGGMIPTASDSVVVSGMRDGKPFKQEVDVAGLFLDKEPSAEVMVSSGDRIYVHRAPVFYIYGEAQRPNAYRLERNMTVLQALAQGGGPTIRGTQRSIKLYRRNEAGDVVKTSPKLTDAVHAEDVIFVEESLF